MLRGKGINWRVPPPPAYRGMLIMKWTNHEAVAVMASVLSASSILTASMEAKSRRNLSAALPSVFS